MTPLPRTPSFRLDGRRALVTGAGRGIGRACAAALAEAGAHVVLAARSADQIAAGAEAIRTSGGSAEAMVLDVSDVTAVRRALGAVAAFDILINNAGTNRPKPILSVTEDDYDAVLSLNLRAAFFMAQTVAARMVEDDRKGSLIHMGSQMGHVGGPNRTLYCASKWGLEGFNKALALDLAAAGVRSNIIAPTFVETPLTRPYLEDEAFRLGVMSKIKLGRLGAVEDVMGAVLYFASDASSLVTGTSLLIDGGWTAD